MIFGGAIARLLNGTPRTCPKCGERQLVPKKNNGPVACKVCGAPIPPRETRSDQD